MHNFFTIPAFRFTQTLRNFQSPQSPQNGLKIYSIKDFSEWHQILN